MRLLPWVLAMWLAIALIVVGGYMLVLAPTGLESAGFAHVDGSEFYDIYPESSIATMCDTWTSHPEYGDEIAAAVDTPDASWDGVVLLRRCEIEAVDIPPAQGVGVPGGGVPQLP